MMPADSAWKRYSRTWPRPEDFLTRFLGRPVADLPTLPETALELLTLVNEREPDMDRLIRVIGQDPPLAARILKLANSPLFGIEHRITSLSRAVLLLGPREIRDLALSLSVFESAGSGGDRRRSENRPRLWKHSLTVGLLAETLARDEFSLGPGFYVYGLIHDLGKVLVEAYLPDRFDLILEELARTGRPWPEVEEGIMGFDHAVIGQALLDHWGLPESISQAVGWHHEPWLAGNYQDQAGVLFMANLFAKMLGCHSFPSEAEIELRRVLTMQAVAFLTHQGWVFEGRLVQRLETRLATMMESFETIV